MSSLDMEAKAQSLDIIKLQMFCPSASVADLNMVILNVLSAHALRFRAITEEQRVGMPEATQVF